MGAGLGVGRSHFLYLGVSQTAVRHLKKIYRIYLIAIAGQDGKLENVKIRHSDLSIFQLISLALYASLAISTFSV